MKTKDGATHRPEMVLYTAENGYVIPCVNPICPGDFYASEKKAAALVIEQRQHIVKRHQEFVVKLREKYGL